MMDFTPGINVSLLLAASVMIAACAASQSNVKKMSIAEIKVPHLGDSGHAENCGKEPFNLTWTPKLLDPSGQVTLHLDFTVPYDMNGGSYNASIYFAGDKEPFIGYQDNFACSDIDKYFPCPLKKGVKMNTSKTLYNLHGLTAFPGNYVAILELKNKEGQLIICAKIEAQVKGFEMSKYRGE